MNTHPLLDAHERIAWDIDETLVNGANSAVFCAYIAAHPGKQHHLVTHRTPTAWALQAYAEVAPFGVTPDMIASIHHVPEDYYWAYAEQQRYPDDPRIQLFYEWKGDMCRQLGCTVLVDDKPLLVIQGCTRYGILHVDANDPRFVEVL